VLFFKYPESEVFTGPVTPGEFSGINISWYTSNVKITIQIPEIQIQIYFV